MCKVTSFEQIKDNSVYRISYKGKSRVVQAMILSGGVTFIGITDHGIYRLGETQANSMLKRGSLKMMNLGNHKKNYLELPRK